MSIPANYQTERFSASPLSLLLKRLRPWWHRPHQGFLLLSNFYDFPPSVLFLKSPETPAAQEQRIENVQVNARCDPAEQRHA